MEKENEMMGRSSEEAKENMDQREIPMGSSISKQIGGLGAQNGLSMVVLFLRLVAAMATLSGAIVMGTTNETLPFSTQSSQFKANYNDLPMFTFFVIANSIVCGYLFLCLPISIFQMMEVAAGATTTRIMLLIFDTVAMGIVTAGASVAAATVYLAYKGNAAANWVGFCAQFNSFCRRISGSLIASFSSVLALMLLIIISAVVISPSRRSS